MSEFPKEAWAFLGVLVGGLVTFITSLFSTSAKLRDELRAENLSLKERVSLLEDSVKMLIDQQIEWRRERAILKRALDKRDAVIADLRHELDLLNGRINEISEPMI